MCQRVTRSTTVDCDLSAANTDCITFVRLDADLPDGRLAYPHRWFVSWMGGCSAASRSGPRARDSGDLKPGARGVRRGYGDDSGRQFGRLLMRWGWRQSVCRQALWRRRTG